MRLRKSLLCLLMALALGFLPAQARETSLQFEGGYSAAMMNLTPLSDSAQYQENLLAAQAYFADADPDGSLAAYTQGMLQLYTGELSAAGATFSALTADDALAAELNRWRLPDAASLSFYAQARAQENLGTLSQALALYEQMPNAGLFDAVARMAALKQQLNAGASGSFSFARPQESLYVGEQLDLSQSLSSAESASGLVWQSVNPVIATVDSTGLVSAVSEGTTVIAVTDGERTEFCTLVVLSSSTVQPTAVYLSQDHLELDPNGQAQLTAAIEPEGASGSTLLWASTDSSVVIVANGLVAAVGEGRAIVTATAPNGVAGACVVTVRASAIEVTSILLNSFSLELETGETARLIASVLPADATDPALVWSSSDSSVASVFDGNVTAQRAGSAVITAETSNGVSAKCEVTVKEAAPGISQYHGGYDVTRSSAYVNKSTSISVEAACAVDGNSNTAWNTNRKGAGEWICLTVRDGKKYTVSSLGFLNGYVKSSSAWKNNARIRQLDVYCDGSFVTSLTLSDTREYQSFQLPEPMIGSEFKFVIQSVYSGSSYPDCALSELELLG